MRQRDAIALALIVIAWLAIVVVIGPGGEVALDDSWNFAKPVKHLLDTGHLEFDPFNSAASVLHIFWGAAFCKVLGFSIVACQISNFVAALLALLAAYAMARAFGLRPGRSLLVTAATAASPPFFVTAFTFQSDFLYLLPAWAGLAFVLRFLSRRRELDLLLGAVCFALSIWNKVHGLFLAAAVVFYLLLVRKKKAILWRQIAYSFFLPAFSYLVFTWTLPLIHPVRTTMERKTGEFAARLLDPTVWLSDGSSRAAVVLLCLGVYALPVLVFAFTRTDRTIFSRKAKLLAATLAAVLAGVSSAYWLAGRGQLFPFTSSVLREWPPMTTRSILLPWTVLSVAGSFVLLYLLGREFVLARRRGDSRPLLVGLAILSQALPLAPILLFMDRYFLVFIPLVLMLVLHSSPTESHPVTPRWIVPAKVGAAVVLLLAVLTIDGLRVVQYRNGVAAQWRAADELVAAGNAPLTVDGGYSWFGWKNYPECLVGKPDSFRPNELHSSYVVELCPWAPIRYDVFFHEMPPPRVLLRTTTFADPLEGPRPIYVYQRPPNTQ